VQNVPSHFAELLFSFSTGKNSAMKILKRYKMLQEFELQPVLVLQVWQAAAGQMFFSLSVSMGGLIMYSSYNDFRNNVYR
jgi:SNF family Na+-dependent transporter